MEEIVQLADKVDAWVYSDEVYRGAELNGKETPSFWGTYDKVIVNGGLSKVYGLPGLRIGWLVGPKKIIEKNWAYHDYTTIASSIISDRVAAVVLRPEVKRRVLSRSRKILNENLAALTKWVERHGNLFYFVPPKAGGIAFLRYNLKINSRELTTELREKKGVFVIDGNCFGMDYYIRIGIGSQKEYFLTGLNLISEMLQEIRGG